MRIGSLFSGIGGLELGLERAGLGHTLWQVEKSKFCRSVLARHWPKAERFEDVREVGADELCRVDIICGGSPCQGFSGAGDGKGFDHDLSGLWCEFDRIVSAIRPRWVVFENVESGAKKWFDKVVHDLQELGYECLPIPLSAADVGAPHIRKRMFIVACNPDQDCEPVVSLNEEVAGVRGASEGFSGWPEPPVVSVDDGFPDGMGAYGNAVVPRCAEVVGWVVRELSGMVSP